MDEFLPIPVKEAKSYLNDEQFASYKAAYEDFYSMCISNPTVRGAELCQYNLEQTEKKLPSGNPAYKDVLIKLYQCASIFVDTFDDLRRCEMKNPEILNMEIQKMETQRKKYKEKIREEGVSIQA